MTWSYVTYTFMAEDIPGPMTRAAHACPERLSDVHPKLGIIPPAMHPAMPCIRRL